jgi:long-subunit acyl-CoA synthetase (AMP-forming)
MITGRTMNMSVCNEGEFVEIEELEGKIAPTSSASFLD